MDKENEGEIKCTSMTNNINPQSCIAIGKRDVETESNVSLEMKNDKSCYCCSVVKEFNKESTLHGPKYITKSGTSLAEKYISFMTDCTLSTKLILIH